MQLVLIIETQHIPNEMRKGRTFKNERIREYPDFSHQAKTFTKTFGGTY